MRPAAAFAIAASVAALLAACASAPDRFYTLIALPTSPPSGHVSPNRPVHLNVTVPSMIDRSEMVLPSSANGMMVFDHERWAAPLSDQVSQTLARDLERRRADLLVGDRRFDPGGLPPINLRVDIVGLAAHRGAEAHMEAHWHIGGPGADALGSESFSVPVHGEDFAAVASAYSELLGALADRLAAAVPNH